MNELANTLRMYAEDMHSRTGFNYISRTMSQAADRLEELEKERSRLILAVADHVTARCELAKRIADLEKENDDLESEIRVLVRQNGEWREDRDLLAAQNVAFREVLKFYMEHGITEPLYYKARDALNLPDIASEALKRRDAEVLRRAADRLQGEFYEHAAADVLRMVSITPDDHDAQRLR